MKLSAKGIIVGAITDIVLSNVLGVVFSIYVMTSRGILTMPKDQVGPATSAAIHNSPVLYAMQLLLGFACSVIGGYVAARLAKHDELLNGALASWLCIGLGVYSWATGKSPVSVPVHLLFVGMTLISYITGAYLRRRSIRARSGTA